MLLLRNEIIAHFKLLRRVPTDKKLVYLTFDDGPHVDLTPRFLDILAKYNVKATFFLCGNRVKKNPKLAREIHSQGHMIGSHGYEHIRLIWRKQGFLQHQVLLADKAISEAAGITPQYFRPPYGIFGLGLLSILKKMDKTLVLWDCNSQDYRPNRSSDKILSYIQKRVRAGSIILLHDGPPHEHRTHRFLPDLIQILSAGGYDFAALPWKGNPHELNLPSKHPRL